MSAVDPTSFYRSLILGAFRRLDTQRADLMAKKGKLESGGRLSPEGGKGSKKKGFLGSNR